MKVTLPLQCALLLALSGLLAPVARAEFDRASAIRLAASVMKIEVQRPQGGYAIGSGVAVAAGVVATNCHVTREGRQIHVVRGGQRWRAVSQAVDLVHDLCVLRVPAMVATAVPLAPSQALRLGQQVLALGFTGGIDLQHSEGDIVGLHALDGGRVIQIRNGFNSGASGGGLFDEEMRLVGILTFRLRGGVSHYFAAPTEWLLPLVGATAQYEPIEPLDVVPLPFWQQPTASQPNFLQAAVLERARRWDDLEVLASAWVRQADDDPQPWYLQGLALLGQRRWPEAQRALERSIQLEPASQDAWYQLGLVQLAQGRVDAARQARSRLEAMKSELAPELARALADH